MGPVFRAFDQDRDRLVAIKLFRLDLPPERVHQLVAEFEKLIAAELQHPVIAAPRATGIDGNSAYLAQDFAAADSLDIVMRENGAAPAEQVLRVAGQLAEALDYAADRQVVHGALHPRDILLSQDDIRIVGLGVARALERAGVTAPVRRPYAPPERINDLGWDRSADVFSLAAIVFEMLSGKRVGGTGSEAAEGLSEVPTGSLDAVQRVFALALASDPTYRYTTATAFTDALKSALDIEIVPTEPAPRPKPRRRPRLRVVALEPELPLAEEAQATEEVQAVPEVRAPRRRSAPAPTPVAIETVHEALEVPDVQEAAPEPAPSVVEEPAVEELALSEVEGPLNAFEPEPQLESEPEPEPELALEPEPITPVVSMPRELPNPESQIPNPVWAAAPSHAPSPVWPIGVAAVLGIALGFGAGYTVAIRDRATAPAAAVTTPVVQQATPPAGKELTEVAAAPAAPQALVPPKPTAEPSAKAGFAGLVMVRSTPLGARVIVDGKDRGQTPATIRDLARGEHRVRIVRDGYTSAERRVVLSPSQPSQSLSVPLAKEPRARANGLVAPKPAVESRPAKADVSPVPAAVAVAMATLVVESRPQGAAVMIDGRPVGTTPLSLSDVGVGSHAVRLEREGYRIWTAPVKVMAGEQNRVTASLEK